VALFPFSAVLDLQLVRGIDLDERRPWSTVPPDRYPDLLRHPQSRQRVTSALTTSIAPGRADHSTGWTESCWPSFSSCPLPSAVQRADEPSGPVSVMPPLIADHWLARRIRKIASLGARAG